MRYKEDKWMDLRQIRYFIEVVRNEHISKTADFLNITQPTLSKAIGSLERELGVSLFDRVGNRIRLNQNGRRFYENVRLSMNYLDSGILSAKQTEYDVTGTISISCWCFAPILWRCIDGYSRLNPKTDFMVFQSLYDQKMPESDQTIDFILRGYADFSEEHVADQFWVRQKLFSEENLLVIGPMFPQFHELTDHTDTVDLTRLKDAPFITMKTDSPFFHDITYQICKNAGFWPHTYFQTDDFVMKMQMINSGNAIAFLPQCCLDNARALCPGLKAMKIQGYHAKRNVALLRKKRVLLSEAAADFWDYVLDYYNLPPDTRD